MSQSDSERWREHGNQCYEKVSKKFSTDDDQQELFEDALRCYKKALEHAVEDEDTNDKISALKNMAMTEWKLANIDNNGENYFPSSLEHFHLAYELGKETKQSVWKKNMEENMTKCLDDAMKYMAMLTNVDRSITFSQKIEASIEDSTIKVKCSKDLAAILYKKAVDASESGDFKKAMYLLKECYMPLEKLKDLHISDEVESLSDKIQLEKKMVEARICIQTGKKLLDEAIEGKTNEEPMTEATLFGAIDAFQEAMQIVGESHLDIEAECMSYTGRVYGEVLDQTNTAKDYFMRSIHLCESMTSQSFILQNWYRRCTQFLERSQQQTVEKEEKSRHEFVKKELEKEMKLLKEGRAKYNKDICGLMCYISKTFPLKGSQYTLPKIEELKDKSMKELKSICRKMIVNYSSDKQKIKEKKLKVLNEEITMVLNRIMETLKSMD